ncbi:MAG: hypothetical protein ACREQJ_16995, partial [Candidatus Binatia bacterium]
MRDPLQHLDGFRWIPAQPFERATRAGACFGAHGGVHRLGGIEQQDVLLRGERRGEYGKGSACCG